MEKGTRHVLSISLIEQTGPMLLQQTIRTMSYSCLCTSCLIQKRKAPLQWVELELLNINFQSYSKSGVYVCGHIYEKQNPPDTNM